MCNIQIRPAVCGDELILAQIQTESWKAAFADILPPDELEKYTDLSKTVEMYTRILQQEFPAGLLLFVDGGPHCIAFWGKSRTDLYPESAELICIHSRKGNWGKGYGSTMMDDVLEKIKAAGYQQVILWVFEQNLRARRFYEKHGFTMTEHRQNHFGADEVLYQKQL